MCVFRCAHIEATKETEKLLRWLRCMGAALLVWLQWLFCSATVKRLLSFYLPLTVTVNTNPSILCFKAYTIRLAFIFVQLSHIKLIVLLAYTRIHIYRNVVALTIVVVAGLSGIYHGFVFK